MKRIAICAAVLLPVLSIGADLLAQKSDKNKRDNPQAAVVAAFQKAYPNATIKRVTTEREGGKLVYEVESVDQGRRRDILYTPEGNAIEVEEEIAQSALPQAVLATVKKQHPKATISKCEKATRGATTEYEIQLKGADLRELVLSPDGRLIKAK